MTKHVKTQSKIEKKLSAQDREELDRLMQEEGYTYAQIKEWCNKKGYDISQSSVARYGKKFFEAYENLNKFERLSKILAGEADSTLSMESSISRLLLHDMFKAVINGEVDVTEQLQFISTFSALQNSSVRRETVKIQAEAIDRPALFLEHFQWIAEKIRLKDPDAFTALARNIDFLTKEYKAEHA